MPITVSIMFPPLHRPTKHATLSILPDARLVNRFITGAERKHDISIRFFL